MQDTIEQIKLYFRDFWENRWLALSIAAILSVIGWSMVVTAPNRYEVSTNVYVDTRSMLRPLLKGIAVESDVTQSTAKVMKRTLLSRPNLETVAKKTGLDAKIETPEAYEKLMEMLVEKVLITGGLDFDNVYTISFEHRDPVMAKNVVQTLLNLFIEKVVGASRLDTDVTKRFLDDKLQEYVTRLTQAEERLKQFKKEHPGVLITDDRTYFNRLETMRTQLQTAKLELQESEFRRDALSKQLSSTPSVTGGSRRTVGGVVGLTVIDQRILEAQANLESMQLKFTDLHPDVMAAKRTLSQLQEQKRNGFTGGTLGGTAGTEIVNPAVANPAYQNLKLALAEEEAKTAALKARVQEYQKRLIEQEADADTLPEIEAELARLDRDYLVNKREYEDLLERRESADISEGMINADKLQFEILDPPRVPLSPTGPNRLKWVTMVFFLALGAGVGASILLSQIRPKIYNRQSLKDLTTLPILGTVSKLNSVGNHLAKGASHISYSLASGALLLGYAALVLSYIMNADYLKEYVGFNYAQHVEEQIGDEVLAPVKDVLDQM
jgi:polysaccharide chain length determinant protein (PEP-CTERM system associated)